jgi:hypothetical protein
VNANKSLLNPERVEATNRFGQPSLMPQSLAKILVHTVFSTKDCRPFLCDQALREELHRYVGGILAKLQYQPVIVGGVRLRLRGLSRRRGVRAKWRT